MLNDISYYIIIQLFFYVNVVLMQLLNFVQQSLLGRLEVGAAKSASFSADGEMVAVGLKNGEVIVLSVNGMKLWGKRRDRSGAISDVK